MIRLGKALTLVSLLCATIFSGHVVADYPPSLESLSARRLEAMKRLETSARRAGTGDARRDTQTSTPQVKNITFSNPKASRAFTRRRSSFFPSSLSQTTMWMAERFPK